MAGGTVYGMYSTYLSRDGLQMYSSLLFSFVEVKYFRGIDIFLFLCFDADHVVPASRFFRSSALQAGLSK